MATTHSPHDPGQGKRTNTGDVLTIVDELRRLTSGIMAADRAARDIARERVSVYNWDTDFEPALVQIHTGANVIYDAALERLERLLGEDVADELAAAEAKISARRAAREATRAAADEPSLAAAGE